MTVKRSEYGTVKLPVDIITTISTILNDVCLTQRDVTLQRSIERDANVRLCGLEPGEFDQVTISAYLTLVETYALESGQTLEELTRAAFKVYMNLRLQEYIMRNSPEPLPTAQVSDGGPPGDDLYSRSRREFRRAQKAKQKSEMLNANRKIHGK
jgi:hypothetical protein